MGFFPGPKGREALGSQHPAAQNLESFGEERRRKGSHTELVRESRGNKWGSSMEKTQCLMERRLLGSSPPKRGRQE